jgi:hypothetical protein
MVIDCIEETKMTTMMTGTGLIEGEDNNSRATAHQWAVGKDNPEEGTMTLNPSQWPWLSGSAQSTGSTSEGKKSSSTVKTMKTYPIFTQQAAPVQVSTLAQASGGSTRQGVNLTSGIKPLSGGSTAEGNNSTGNLELHSLATNNSTAMAIMADTRMTGTKSNHIRRSKSTKTATVVTPPQGSYKEEEVFRR